MTPTTIQNARSICATGRPCISTRRTDPKAKPFIWAILLLIGLASPALAQTYTAAPAPFQTFLDNSGNIVNLGCVWTYTAGTTTPITTYSDATGTANTNPIKSGSDGRFVVFLTPGQSYKFVYENIPCSAVSHGTVLKTVDNISAMPGSGVNLDVTGTAGENIAAGAAVYLSDGSGSKTPGLWYNASSSNGYSSNTALSVGVAVSAISSTASGTIRVAGRVTGLTGLVVGTRYYVAAVAGTMTSTAPANTRFLGAADSTTSMVIAPNPASPILAANNIAEGRLTAVTGTAVTTVNTSAATSIFYTPYKGNRVALFDGTSQWNVRTFSEITISLSGCTASRPYDVFLYDNASVVTAEILVWTSATARATALTTQDGVLVKTGATTRRYVGTVYCNATGGQTDDTSAKRYVWNYYNRVPRFLRVLEATDSWTYTTSTLRQANASTANQLDFVIGVAEVTLEAGVIALASSDQATGTNDLQIGIGEDSTTTQATGVVGRFTHNIATVVVQIAATLRTTPAVGRHFYAWLEYASGAGTVTWRGDNGGTVIQSGIFGSIEG